MNASKQGNNISVFKRYGSPAYIAVSYTHLDVYKRQDYKGTHFLGFQGNKGNVKLAEIDIFSE